MNTNEDLEFLKLVQRMRYYQKDYFRFRTKNSLQKAIALEMLVDAWILREAPGSYNPDNCSQPDLFFV